MKVKEIKHHENQLRNRVMACFLVLSILAVTIILWFYVNYSDASLREQIKAERQLLIEHSMERLNSQAAQVNEFVAWIDQNDNIRTLLERSSEQSQIYNYTNYNVSEELFQQFSYRAISEYIISMAIIGKNGVIMCAGDEGYLLSEEALEQVAEYDVSGGRWGALMENPNHISHNEYVIPFYYDLSSDSANSAGRLYILFSVNLILDQIDNITALDDGMIYVKNQNGDILFRSGKEGSLFLTLTEKSLATNWSIEYIVADDYFDSQMSNIWRTIILLCILLIPLLIFLSSFLSKNISAPIARLAVHIRRIGSGDFAEYPQLKETGEIAELDRELTKMGLSIQELFRTQEEKRQVELTLMQAQLNPHFLYNTLGSIRMMANMQGNSSVAEMIDALNILLRANLSAGDDTVPLSAELETVKSYLFLQNIRLKGRLKYTVETSDDIEKCLVLKNILQPVVENAVIHGIGNNPLGGVITIETSISGRMLSICISDNGAGMTEENVKRLLADISVPGQIKTYGHGIGLYNTNAKIRLFYGEGYDITITSEEGKGSCFKFNLPCIGLSDT